MGYRVNIVEKIETYLIEETEREVLDKVLNMLATTRNKKELQKAGEEANKYIKKYGQGFLQKIRNKLKVGSRYKNLKKIYSEYMGAVEREKSGLTKDAIIRMLSA